MSTRQIDELEAVLDRVRDWPRDRRLDLARRLLNDLGPPAEGMAGGGGARRSIPRGRPVSELIGLGAGSEPPPDDDEVRRWVEEHRAEKYA